MQEEDDWLDWKVAREMLENWLGLRQESGAFPGTLHYAERVSPAAR